LIPVNFRGKSGEGGEKLQEGKRREKRLLLSRRFIARGRDLRAVFTVFKGGLTF